MSGQVVRKIHMQMKTRPDDNIGLTIVRGKWKWSKSYQKDGIGNVGQTKTFSTSISLEHKQKCRLKPELIKTSDSQLALIKWPFNSLDARSFKI